MKAIKTQACDPCIQYLGKWDLARHSTGSQFSTCIFHFRGSFISVSLTTGRKKGHANIFLNDVYEATIDCYQDCTDQPKEVFRKENLCVNELHYLTIVASRDKNVLAGGCELEIDSFSSEEAVDYPEMLDKQMREELDQIQRCEKPWLPSEQWRSVPYQAHSPIKGVKLLDGLTKSLFDTNIELIKYCFLLPDYCEGEPPDFVNEDCRAGRGWSRWLPGSNEARMLGGASYALCWEEDSELREIVDKIVSDIKARMREDGYNNYYSEDVSYKHSHLVRDAATEEDKHDVMLSERKNYDRVFWTRGLIAAHRSGNPDALPLVRKKYDWFNAQEQYLKYILLSGNSPNGIPGGPLLYHTELGKSDDIITNERFFDQDYWFQAFVQRQPMALSHYPGDRPHCYDILLFEALADQYRATGNQKYLHTLLGGWDVYHQNYKHIGGATAICEHGGTYPPKSYYLTTGHNGETCASIFWIWINHRLMQLFPDDERYPAEIEEAIFNILCAMRTEKGFTRYHNRLHGKKEEAKNENACCEVSSVMCISSLPQYIYMTDKKGVIINQFIASELEQPDYQLQMKTDFPYSGLVTISVLPKISDAEFSIRIRIPTWVTSDVTVYVNDKEATVGESGTYVEIQQNWQQDDLITFELPMKVRLSLYTGFDQVDGNYNRYATLYGPILLALTGEMAEDEIAHLNADPESFEKLLEKQANLTFTIRGYPQYSFVPYFKVQDEVFTCFPIIEAI